MTRPLLAVGLLSGALALGGCAPLLRAWQVAGERLAPGPGPAARQALPAPRRPWVVAHRGYSAVAPENTLAALRAAVAAGADAVEFDVRQTADGEAVLMHDPTVERTTDGEGPVRALTAVALRRLDAGRWKGEAFAGERVPTLAEALGALAGRAVAVVELKEAAPALVRRTAEALARHTPPGGAVVISFHPAALRRLAALAPERPRGLLVRPQALLAAAGVPADLVLGFHPVVAARSARELRRLGLPVFAWTVDEPEAMARLLGLGVAGLVTNEVAAAVALRDRLARR